ncbi:Aminoglycoside/hydroxyurea antibiotic resistance kinase [Legionella busanensis]|uniref:Aminoglycoside/hydroxyurea antibiotic resistance kinase n=1 Tax=Legionella busanensis TaxID=190655 RepID=A0A378JGU9_9GAMM|nr:aminoglycoside phosphotransferase family protein [Legionella busanensis]STX50405.1 Aminoglycoside/hydroxyurea antibiotic resistance kinase [Legionella busanensis]
MKTLKKNVLGAFGMQGQQWLDTLPATIKLLSTQWLLANLKPVDNMTWHYVAKGMLQQQTPIVLKLGCDKNTISDEYQALTHFNGQGCINVLAYDLNYNALLLEQATPGHSLKHIPELTLHEKITYYASVVKQLAAKSPPKNHQFYSVSHWLRVIDNLAPQQFETSLIDKAKRLKSKLLNTGAHTYLCHGDLHLDNILNHQKNWVAIDPKGIIGDMGFEAAAYDLISKEELNQNKQNCKTMIQERLTKLATALDIDLTCLTSWVFLRVILSAQWFIEDKGDPAFMLSLAQLIYPLI